MARLIANLHPFLQAKRLVLQCVRQFVRQHWTLRLHVHPVQQVYGLGFGVVVSRHLLLEERNQKRLQIEIARQQSKFLQHDFRALQPLRILVLLHVLLDKGLHLAALHQPPLDLLFDGQLRLPAGKLQDLVNRLEKLLGFLRGDDLFW